MIFVEHRLLYFTNAFVPEEPFEVPFGKARRCTQGDDITIVGISNMLVEALRASDAAPDKPWQARKSCQQPTLFEEAHDETCRP